jgi:hypothetical protein
VERPDHNDFYRIDIEDINDPFIQREGNVYWLQFDIWTHTGWIGWKTSTDHWNDDAVWNNPDGPFEWHALYDPCTGETIDLAFEITTGPAYSHPNNVLWEYKAYDYDEVLVGYDKHPTYDFDPPREPVFRYSVKLPREHWFFQKDGSNIYWLSVVAVYKDGIPSTPWGWTNHKHVFMDDAVAGYLDNTVEPPVWQWEELYNQTGHSTDMSFQIFTDPDPNLGTCWDPAECGGQTCGDINCDGSVNFIDLGLMKVAFFSCAGDANYNCCADLNHDGCVNFIDLGLLKVCFFTMGWTPATGEQSCPPGY